MSTSTTAENLTIRDPHGGASLVLERLDDGTASAWIAPPGGDDGHSVRLTGVAITALAAYLGLVPAMDPVVDCDGDAVWLTDEGYVTWLAPDKTAPAGWRRLYVEPGPEGGEPA